MAITRQEVGQAMAELMPRIIRGIRLDFFVRKGITQTQLLVLIAVHACPAPDLLRRIAGPRRIVSARRSASASRIEVANWGGADRRCTMGSLARNMHVRMPTATGVIDRLVRAGYVRRIPHPTDRRQVIVAVTAKGQHFIRDFQALIRRRWEEVLRSLSSRELATFHHVITKLKAQL